MHAEAEVAEVAGVHDTSYSVLVERVELSDGVVGVGLTHPAYHADTLAFHLIAEGELLISIYCAFVFGWVALSEYV
jgi:hypothetical protein